MEILEYLNSQREIYNTLLSFIEDKDEVSLKDLLNNIEKQKIIENSEDFKEFLLLIVKISDNHYRYPDFFDRIEHIFLSLKEEIIKTFSNLDIFNIFKNNKKIVLFLMTNKILTVDKSLSDLIMIENSIRDDHYSHFFYTEIKQFISKETIEEIENEVDFDSFDQKRQIGENDTYICSLIRKDSVEEFIIYVNQKNLSLSSTINPSIFETNQILIKNKEIELIEYAAFYGSIQIFQYLRLNNVDVQPSLWIYTIHGQNAELIHLLEENKVEPPNHNYETCLFEAIKCHHIEIANYIKENLIDNYKVDIKFIKCCLKYRNYNYFPDNFDQNDVFYFLCQYEYDKIVNFLMESKEEKMKSICNQIIKLIFLMIFKFNFFLYNNVISILLFFFNDVLREAANQNQIDVVYFLLLKRNEIPDDCFSKCKGLVKIAIPKSITKIGRESFFKCRSLEKILIPQSVTSIEERAFDSCESLKKIKIPSSLNIIEKGVFSGCHSITKIKIPSSIKFINEYAFSGCSLRQIRIPSSVTTIGEGAFAYNSLLNEVILPNSITQIELCTFLECKSLKQIAIPSSVTVINKRSFDGCKSLTQIQIPSSVTSIEYWAFNNCSLLSEISIPSSVKTIDAGAFINCEALTHITIPSAVKEIKPATFQGCSSLTQIDLHPSITVIGERAFYGCSSLTQIDIPSTLLSIKDQAFRGCSSLLKINLPSSLTSINEYSLYGCSSLTEITIPSSVKSIQDYAFGECRKIQQIKIPSSVTFIGRDAFFECKSLTEIIIPNSVKSIDEHAFSECSLFQVKLPSSINVIQEGLFYMCRFLDHVDIPSSVTKIESFAFFGCTSLKEINIPSSVKTIGNNAFEGCSSLKNITLPKSIRIENLGLNLTVNINLIDAHNKCVIN